MPPIDTALIPSLLAALGLGLLIGAVRERQHKDPMAGVRTHALVALLGVIGLHIGVWALVLVLVLLVGLVWISYWRQSEKDSGLTGEITLLLTCLLGALCLSQPGLATASGVVVAVLLYAKASLHRFTKEIVSETEVHDGLILLGSALVILPLLPNNAIGPYAVLNPTTIWRLVVLIMLISTIGHISLRVIGNRWGLALAGFFPVMFHRLPPLRVLVSGCANNRKCCVPVLPRPCWRIWLPSVCSYRFYWRCRHACCKA